MAKEQGRIVRLGIFVIISVVLFIIAIYYIGNNQNLFKSTFLVSSVFPNVSGLQPGNNVRYAGIKIGTVKQIVLLSDSSLRVDMELQANVQQFIRKDAIASIGSDGLVGNMIVDINPGQGILPPVENGDFLQSFSRLKTEDIIKTLGKTNENLAIFTNDLLEITEKVNEGKGTIAMLLQDSMLAIELNRSIQNLRSSTAYLNLTTQQLHRIIARIGSGEGLLGELLQDTITKPRLDAMITELDTQFLVQLNRVMADLKQSGENISAFSADLKTFSQQFHQSDGLVGALLTDTVAVNDLRQTLENLNEGTARFNENMEALKHNFLFRRYFKKQENLDEKANN